VRKFLATETFWAKFYALSAEQKEQSRVAWEIFKTNPFDPRLGAHKINALSGRAKRTVYAAVPWRSLKKWHKNCVNRFQQAVKEAWIIP
jgi:hypothetical protein